MSSDEQEGWASYAAEQERHTETTARLEDMTREARLSREATEKAVRRANLASARFNAVESIQTHNGTDVTPANLRYAATHQALNPSWIFDVLIGLASALEVADQ